ncbi:hypothetical protein, partial [Lactobacillus equicursoris]|uniref:hypothetical protein n=1 Tax=Lactobacillus equicursoris TaxID=420645 RepID=UPI001EE34EB9
MVKSQQPCRKELVKISKEPHVRLFFWWLMWVLRRAPKLTQPASFCRFFAPEMPQPFSIFRFFAPEMPQPVPILCFFAPKLTQP